MVKRIGAKAKFLILITLLIAAGGCASTIGQPLVNAMGQVKAFNRHFLHANPQPGDYALYANEDGTHQMKREITAVHDGVVEIKTSFPKTAAIIASMQRISFHSRSRMDGTVLDAYMLDSGTGEKTALAIAQPGDYNYIGETNMKTLPVAETIVTPAGRFQSNNVVLFNQSIDFPGVHTTVTSVWYYHPEVKFGLVRQHNLMETDASIVEIAGFINKISPIPQVYRSLSSYIIEKSRHQTRTSQLDLVETN